MPQVKLMNSARHDLWEIYAYLAENADIPTADQLRDELLEKFKLIANNRFIGKQRFELADDLRSFVHDNFVIFYFPNEKGVMIFRILHSARNIEAILQEDLPN